MFPMNVRMLVFYSFLFFCPLFAVAQDGLAQDSPAEAYQRGLKSFQEKNYSEARAQFHAAWESEPDNPFVLYNWGLSEFQLGNKGMALAAWRKALFLSPSLSLAETAIEFLMTTTSLGHNSRSQGYWELIRQKVLSKISANQAFFMSLIFLLGFGWIAIKYFGQRKFAIDEELPLPSTPWMGIALFLFFLLAQTTAALKIYDYFSPRATVISQTVTVKSAPSAESSNLFEIYEGSEVLLKRKTPEWSQVKYPGGLTGWVQNQNIFHTSGREL